MSKLEPPDTFCLSSAVGWMELGNASEALAELDKISAEHQQHPDVLEVRWFLTAQTNDWNAALKIAQALVKSAPKRASAWLHQAYAIRRATGGGLQQARDVLLPAQEKFPCDVTIVFNLSCYACQLGKLDEARTWLERAATLGGKEKIKTMALADSDLQPLWEEIRKL